jgi:hypothetical protein
MVGYREFPNICNKSMIKVEMTDLPLLKDFYGMNKGFMHHKAVQIFMFDVANAASFHTDPNNQEFGAGGI